jgi:vanillate O-demethylase ferredoxin subunit
MLSVIVDGLWREGDKSLAVRLVAEDGNALPAWQPGAHIDVHLPCGAVRQYSLTGACGDEAILSAWGGKPPRAADRVTFTRRCDPGRN